jgi:hypothetical protein
VHLYKPHSAEQARNLIALLNLDEASGYDNVKGICCCASLSGVRLRCLIDLYRLNAQLKQKINAQCQSFKEASNVLC